MSPLAPQRCHQLRGRTWQPRLIVSMRLSSASCSALWQVTSEDPEHADGPPLQGGSAHGSVGQAHGWPAGMALDREPSPESDKDNPHQSYQMR